MKVGNFHFEYIDGPDDVWIWAIVKDFKTCQDYGEIIMEFSSDSSYGFRNVDNILKILKMFDKEETKIDLGRISKFGYVTDTFYSVQENFKVTRAGKIKVSGLSDWFEVSTENMNKIQDIWNKNQNVTLSLLIEE